MKYAKSSCDFTLDSYLSAAEHGPKVLQDFIDQQVGWEDESLYKIPKDIKRSDAIRNILNNEASKDLLKCLLEDGYSESLTYAINAYMGKHDSPLGYHWYEDKYLKLLCSEIRLKHTNVIQHLVKVPLSLKVKYLSTQCKDEQYGMCTPQSLAQKIGLDQEIVELLNPKQFIKKELLAMIYTYYSADAPQHEKHAPCYSEKNIPLSGENISSSGEL
jgi:hypothetical protein